MNLKILAIGLIGCFTLVYGTPGFQYVSGGISADAALQKLDLQKNKAEMKIQTIKDNIERITDDSAKTKFTIELLGLEHTFKALSNKIKDRKLRYVPKNLSRLLSNFKELLSNLSALEAELHKKAIDNPQIFNGTLNATPKTYCHDDCQCLAESLEDSLSSSATNLWSIGNKILELPEGKRKAEFAGRLEDVTNRLIDIKKSHINKFAEYSDEKMSFPKDALAAALTKTTALKSEIAELKNDVTNELRKVDQHKSSGDEKYVNDRTNQTKVITSEMTTYKTNDEYDNSKLNPPKTVKIEMVQNTTFSKSSRINDKNKLTKHEKIYKTIVIESEDGQRNKRCILLKPDESIRQKRSHPHNIPKDKTPFILIGHGCTTCKQKGRGPYTVRVAKVIPERKSSHSEEHSCECDHPCKCKETSQECKCHEKHKKCKCKENSDEDKHKESSEECKHKKICKHKRRKHHKERSEESEENRGHKKHHRGRNERGRRDRRRNHSDDNESNEHEHDGKMSRILTKVASFFKHPIS